MSTTVVAPTPAQSEASKIISELVVFGITAASIFVKNPATQQHAATIITALSPFLTALEGLL